MKKYYVSLLFVISSSFIIVLFQNCAQPGNLGMLQSPDYIGKASGEFIDNEMPIDDAAQTLDQDQVPALEVVPLGERPNDSGMPEIASGAGGPDAARTTTSNINSSTDSSRNVMADTSTNAEPQVGLTAGPKTLDPEMKDPDSVVGPPIASTGDATVDEKAADAAICKNLVPSDILLLLTGIGNSPGSSSFEILGNKQISLLQNVVRLRALKSLKEVKSLRLDFDAEKSFLLDSNEALYAFKAPSAESSGLKLQLNAGISFDRNSTYELTVNLDLDKQVVANSKKCIFKPVIKSGSIIAVQ